MDAQAVINALRDRARKFVSLDTPEDADLGDMAIDIGTGFLPVVGTAQAGRDFERARREGDKLGMALASLGAVPVVGGVANAANKVRKGAKAAEETVQALRVGPRVEALEVARQNAVKMLGLPENNTAMDRARALGFRSEQFHETTAPRLEQIAQQGFNPRKAIAAASDNETPYGVFTKDSGRSIGLAKEGEVQLPLLVRTNEGTPAHYSFRDRADLSSRLGVWRPEIARLQAAQNMDETARAKQIEALGETLGTRAHPNTSGMSNAEIWKQIDELAAGDTKLSAQTKDLITQELRARGIQTVRLAKDAGSMGRSTETTISLNPANIRSRFAAFDPARVNENDLLGRADPRLLAGIAAGGLGTAAAVAALRNRKQEEEEATR